MIKKNEIESVLEKYDKKNLVVGTIGSHTALQILKGAKDEGFKTLAICNEKMAKLYKDFGVADEILMVESYKDILKEEFMKKLVSKNVILIPHGSFVEYVGAKNIEDKLAVPVFGNRLVLEWESERTKERKWLEKANIKVPKVFRDPSGIDCVVMVKFPGARGGSGYFLANDEKEFYEKLEKSPIKENYTIQEYIVGNLFYPHYFYSPLTNKVELMSMDIRYESNVACLNRLPVDALMKYKIEPTYVVTGNTPVVARESLLPDIIGMGERLIKASKEIFPPGLTGPYCLEMICRDNLEFVVFEISARIVAGTNLYMDGSPYSKLLYDEPMSTGRRIAREIKNAAKKGALAETVY
jgi:5-formaminoimidazole-4-carboxamide-1-(beta)-D-ribofuranosyl 5'-monophosphate synthetase